MELSGIKAWAEADRPREKLLLTGARNLTDSELLAILIRTGTKTLTAVDVAKKILSEFKNDLTELSRVSVSDLAKFNGMGDVKAITIIAALELGRRRRVSEAKKREHIQSSKDIADLMMPHMADLVYEEFVVLMLNRSNEVIDRYSLSTGGVSGTVVDAKMIFKRAIEKLASGIILCHNHPSRNIKPSADDLKLTKKIKEAGDILDIRVLDHIIIGGDQYCSFADEGLI